MLVKHLPRDSALNRDLHGEAADWSVTDHLLAATVDHLAAANWMFLCVNSEDGDQPEPPAPVPRPDGIAAEEEREADSTEEEWDGDALSSAPGPGAGPGAGAGAQAPSAVRGSGDRGDATPSPVQLARFFA